MIGTGEIHGAFILPVRDKSRPRSRGEISSGDQKKSKLFAKTLNGYIAEHHYLPIGSHLATFWASRLSSSCAAMSSASLYPSQALSPDLLRRMVSDSLAVAASFSFSAVFNAGGGSSESEVLDVAVFELEVGRRGMRRLVV
jgi:hypothetical protein